MAPEHSSQASVTPTRGRKVVQLLLRNYGSRFGPGKTHVAVVTHEGGRYLVAACTGKPMHAEEVKGTDDDVTCLRCRPGSHHA